MVETNLDIRHQALLGLHEDKKVASSDGEIGTNQGLKISSLQVNHDFDALNLILPLVILGG